LDFSFVKKVLNAMVDLMALGSKLYNLADLAVQRPFHVREQGSVFLKAAKEAVRGM
jgi:hypothetical protein